MTRRPHHALPSRPRSSRAGRSAPGMSILEVVLASAILAMVAAAIVSSIAFVSRMEMLQQQRLGAYELATRLMLIHLDDEKNLPNPALAYFDGTFYYRWELATLPLGFEPPLNAALIPQTTGAGAIAAGRAQLLIVRVWQARDDGVGGFRHGELLAELRRLHSPLALFSRNPDAARRLTSDMTRALGVASLMGIDGSAPPPPRATPGGGTPPRGGAPGGSVGGTGAPTMPGAGPTLVPRGGPTSRSGSTAQPSPWDNVPPAPR
jgi:hypothetical protein